MKYKFDSGMKSEYESEIMYEYDSKMKNEYEVR